jgi:hypothetical protein
LALVWLNRDADRRAAALMRMGWKFREIFFHEHGSMDGYAPDWIGGNA